MAPPVSQEGRSLGKYRMLEPLGQGGMARVYRAYHPQLNRFVAIKLMRSDLIDDEEFLARFRREAQSVAALRHINIINVFDFDAQGDSYYMVMELLEGDSLKSRLNGFRVRGENMPLGEVIRVLLDVLAGLAYAHSEGMIHRDLKPSNILLTKRGEAVITDFGIAQIVGGTRYTVTGALMGTLHYMAPEQGMRGTCDVRSDIYSIGIMLFEMLTGQPPFDGDTPLAILMKHVNDPLPLPSASNPVIPAPLELVVLKALSKSPEDRFQSAAELAQALQDAAHTAGIVVPDHISLPIISAKRTNSVRPASGASDSVPQKGFDASAAAEPTEAATAARIESPVQDFASSAATLGTQLAGLAMMFGSHQAKKISTQISQASKKLEEKIAGETKYTESNPDDPGSAQRQEQESAGAPDAGGSSLSESAVTPWGKNRLERRREKAERKMRRARESSVDKTTTAHKRGDASAGASLPFLLLTGNALGLYYCGITANWTLYQKGWPMEFLLVAMGLGSIMEAAASIWMLLPVGTLAVAGALLSYFFISERWDQWYLWPLLALIVFVIWWVCLLLNSRGETYSRWWARKLARIFKLLMVAALIAIALSLVAPALL